MEFYDAAKQVSAVNTAIGSITFNNAAIIPSVRKIHSINHEVFYILSHITQLLRLDRPIRANHKHFYESCECIYVLPDNSVHGLPLSSRSNIHRAVDIAGLRVFCWIHSQKLIEMILSPAYSNLSKCLLMILSSLSEAIPATLNDSISNNTENTPLSDHMSQITLPLQQRNLNTVVATVTIQGKSNSRESKTTTEKIIKDLRDKNTTLTNSNNTLKNAISNYTVLFGVNEDRPMGHQLWIYIQRLVKLDNEVPFPENQSRLYLLHSLSKALSIGHLTANRITYDIIL